MIDFIKEYINAILIILIFIGYMIIELILKSNVKKVKKEINKKYSEDELESIENIDSLDQDLYIEYYKRKNIYKYIKYWSYMKKGKLRT